MAQGVIVMRLERIHDEKERTEEKLTDLLALAEEEKRELSDFEKEQATKYRQQIVDYNEEIDVLSNDVERQNGARDVSALVRGNEGGDEGDGGDGDGKVRRYARPAGSSNGPVVYRTFAEYARDVIFTDPKLGPQTLAMTPDPVATKAAAEERLERTLQNTTSTTVAGLIVPSHFTQILDIIDQSRPVVNSARAIPLDRGSVTYPKIDTRPTVVQQTSEKTEAGTVGPAISQATLSALTFLGAANISWQAANWSNPGILDLYIELASEQYARQTEAVACEAMETSAIGTLGTANNRLGTAGTETFAQWRAAISSALSQIYTNTGARMRTNTLYVSGDRFFSLANAGTDQATQVSPVGSLDVGSMTGTFYGLQVVGSHGFDQNTAIVGDSQALLVGENAGNPVELRVVEPRIGGYEIGLIGAFNAVVFDTNRFLHLGTHL